MPTSLLRFAAAALLLPVAQIGLTGAPPGLPGEAAGSASGNAFGAVTLVQAVPGRAVDMWLPSSAREAASCARPSG